jgi:hypothetical protein
MLAPSLLLGVLVGVGPSAHPQVWTGQTFKLTNPGTGKPGQGIVESVSVDKYSGRSRALVSFGDGGPAHEFDVARLELVGRSFREQKAALKRVRLETVKLIKQRLGVDASKVPLFSLRGLLVPSLENAKGGSPFARAYVKEHGVGFDGPLDGFYSRSRAFVDRERSTFDQTIRVHETLHGLSQDFTKAAPPELFEGLTEYFTYEAVAPPW